MWQSLGYSPPSIAVSSIASISETHRDLQSQPDFPILVFRYWVTGSLILQWDPRINPRIVIWDMTLHSRGLSMCNAMGSGGERLRPLATGAGWHFAGKDSAPRWIFKQAPLIDIAKRLTSPTPSPDSNQNGSATVTTIGAKILSHPTLRESGARQLLTRNSGAKSLSQSQRDTRPLWQELRRPNVVDIDTGLMICNASHENIFLGEPKCFR